MKHMKVMNPNELVKLLHIKDQTKAVVLWKMKIC